MSFGKVKIDLLKSLGNKPRTGVVKECLICFKPFYVRPSAMKSQYCSLGCRNLSLYKASPKNCSVCGVEYRVSISQEFHRGESKYCSKPCKGVAMAKKQLGANNPAWKGGISPENHRIRQSKRFKEWRIAVFTRDGYTCQMCFKKGGYLEPDHIKPFAYFPELRFELTNGRTLCKPCHKTTDTYGYKAKALYGLASD